LAAQVNDLVLVPGIAEGPMSTLDGNAQTELQCNESRDSPQHHAARPRLSSMLRHELS